jgi:anaerobic nitric oxide reductase transcription regulator
VLLEVATDLTAALSTEARHQRLVEAVRRVFPCDAAALLRLEGSELVPVATAGLSDEAMRRRFDPSRHPRLDAILRARYPVRFPADDLLPDPFDGLVAGSRKKRLPVHACMGCSLRVGSELVGALTIDALDPRAFGAVDDADLALFAALAAAALRTAGLIESLSRLAERRGLVAESMAEETLRAQGGEIVGRSPAIVALRREIETVAGSDLPVLILGETGTGKELVARRLHALSARARQPLVQVNCAALPESLAESELFGHEKGAFTGAVATRAGKFELADGGTLFLDEVGELPLSTQPKLLRALQSGELQRVGQDRVQKVDVRVIAATNRDLAAEVRAGRFRPDLFHRLSVFPIRVAPLRERREDVPLLAARLLERSLVRLGARRASLSPATLAVLESSDWPGNVRELEHVILRGLLRATAGRSPDEAAVIEPAHLGLGGEAPPSPATTAPSMPGTGVPLGLAYPAAVDAFKRSYLEATLAACRGSWTEAALRLGLDRGNLYRARRRLGL